MSDPINTKTQSKGDIERLLARSILYQMLSFFFRYPEETRDLSAIRENAVIWRDAARELCSIYGGNRLETVLDDLLTMFQNLNADEWRLDYEENLGHTAHSRVPAYELEYGEAHSHREPQQLADIAGFYNAFGLKIVEKLSERGDHVSVECEFMHFLLYKESLALEDGQEEKVEICREGSCRFLSDHLAWWLPTFARRLSKNSGGFMQKVAVFAFEFVNCECRLLGIPSGHEELPVRIIRENEENSCVSCHERSC